MICDSGRADPSRLRRSTASRMKASTSASAMSRSGWWSPRSVMARRRAVLTRDVSQQDDVAKPAKVLGHDHVASCAEMLDNRAASEIASGEPRRLVLLPVRQGHPQRVDLDECRAVVVVDVAASESGLARGWRSVDEDQPCDPCIYADRPSSSLERPSSTLPGTHGPVPDRRYRAQEMCRHSSRLTRAGQGRP